MKKVVSSGYNLKGLFLQLKSGGYSDIDEPFKEVQVLKFVKKQDEIDILSQGNPHV